MAELVRAPARRAGDSGSNPGPGENFSPKLLIYSEFIRSQEKNLNLNRDSNLGPSIF